MNVVQVDDKQFQKVVVMIQEIHSYIFAGRIQRDTLEYLTVAEVADALNVSDNTIYRAIRKGAIRKNEDNKLSPIDVDKALRGKTLRCDARFAEEFRKTYIYK